MPVIKKLANDFVQRVVTDGVDIKVLLVTDNLGCNN